MSTTGRQPSVVSSADDLRRAAASQGGDATMAPNGLTFGRMVDGGKAGKLAAEYRKVVGTAATQYDVKHGLGFVPAWAILVLVTNSDGSDPALILRHARYDKWSASEITVRFTAVTGGTTGTEMWLLIGGER